MIPLPDQPRRYHFWAFISYSTRDQRWAGRLHRRLEGYRVPRHVRPGPPAGMPPTSRLRPVFRDRDELAASADLDAGLRAALDRSRYLIVLATRASAGSRWVDSEVRHFVDSGRTADIFLLVLEGRPGTALDPAVLPAALAGSADRHLWIDARGSAKPTRTALLRLVAGMLGVGFDALWRRDRRRRRLRLTAWTLVATLLAGSVGGVLWRQRVLQERDRPDRQVSAFREYLTASIVETSRSLDPDFTESEVDIDLVRVEDLDGDNLLDFFVFNRTTGFCGSGGCGMDVYRTELPGAYHLVLSLFGHTTPRTRTDGSGGYREIVATAHTIDNEPVSSVYRWTGAEYELAWYEFCDGVFPEYCDPLRVIPIDRVAAGRYRVDRDAAYRVAPEETAPLVRSVAPSVHEPTDIIGEVAGGRWYLAKIWKGRSGFISAADVRPG